MGTDDQILLTLQEILSQIKELRLLLSPHQSEGRVRSLDAGVVEAIKGKRDSDE